MCSRVSKLQRTKGGTFFRDAVHNVWFLGPTRDHNPNGISSALSQHMEKTVFAQLTIITDGQTTLLTVKIGRIYIHSTAMWPKKTQMKSYSGST